MEARFAALLDLEGEARAAGAATGVVESIARARRAAGLLCHPE